MLNDLKKEEQNVDVDIKSQIKTSKLSIDHKLVLKNTSDLRKKLGDVNLYKKFFIKLYKSRTKNFDSLSKNKLNYLSKSFVQKNDTIDLIGEENIKSSLKNNNLIVNQRYINKFKIFIGKTLNLIDSTTNSYSKKVYFLAVLFFIFFSIIFTSKYIVEYNVNEGYKKLIELKDNGQNEEKILNLVKSSINNFRVASIFFAPFSIIPTEKIQTPKHIINGGKSIAYSINNLIKVYDTINLYIKKYTIQNIELTPILQDSKNEISQINSDLNKALKEYNQIKNLNQGDLNDKFEIGRSYLNDLSKYLSIVTDNYQTFLNLLGDKKEKKYLVVFQNADEIRPTGGFMGSMGIIYMYKGKITKFEKEDVYSYEWNLKKADYLRLKAPEGINKLTPILGLRDANYSINLNNSSENINFFINKAGYDLDGIVYINNTFIEDFLKLTGNISFTKIGENIRESNFSEIMSLLVESKKFKSGTIGTPKQILFDFIEEFKTKLIKDGNYLAYIKIILDNISKREIMIYSFSPKENELLANLDLNGKIDYNSSLDFAYPVFTSISGNKSDRYLNRTYKKEVTKNKDCSIDTSLQISVNHNLTLEDETNLKEMVKKYEITTPNILQIQGMGDNWEYIKVLLPKNSIIKEDKNYLIEESESAKIVTFYLKTKRFETKSMTINYKLQNKECNEYSFNLYKQPGIRKYDLFFKNNEASIERKNIKNDFIFKK
nr:DUF4012 domain-containing protein [Candidatus Gracilibacteria bacterium]